MTDRRKPSANPVSLARLLVIAPIGIGLGIFWLLDGAAPLSDPARVKLALAILAIVAGFSCLALAAGGRRVAAWAALFVCFAGIAGIAGVMWLSRQAPPSTAVAQARPPMQLPNVELWPQGVVPVCWSGPALGANAKTLQGAVTEAERAWERVAAVRFQDLGACKQGMAAVRLEPVFDGDNPDAPALGHGLLAQAQSVRLAFAFPSRSGCTRAEDDEVLKTCVYGSAVHELGHVLGLPDTAYSTGADPACRDLLRGDHPALAIPYRRASVMNACDPSHGFGRLSDDDVADIRAFYGKA